MSGSTKRILLVEDDRELGGQVSTRLRAAGYDVIWWQEGRRLLPGALPEVDLVLLDLMLPGTYGLDMLADLRQHHDAPVLVLSARTGTEDKIRALQLGADDYMTKPFWPEELLERVKARLRRPTMQRTDALVAGDLRLDVARREVFIADKSVELTRVEFELLRTLMLRRGEAITRAVLAEKALDPERDGTERTLDVHVSRLRKKLGNAALIETVWGIGYRLAGESAS